MHNTKLKKNGQIHARLPAVIFLFSCARSYYDEGKLQKVA
jgi:hypothetical protein